MASDTGKSPRIKRSQNPRRVAIIGATDRKGRYANMAQQRLMAAGHQVYPVSRDGRAILGVDGFTSLAEVPRDIDTVTVYVRPEILLTLAGDLIALAPERVIFNPGTEAPQLYPDLEQAGIRVVEACTLVLLSYDQFDTA